MEDILKNQDNIVIILNGIANNPTGYCMSVAEWQKAVDILKDAVADGRKNAILVPDVAYLDYSGENRNAGNSSRSLAGCRRIFWWFAPTPFPKDLPCTASAWVP